MAGKKPLTGATLLRFLLALNDRGVDLRKVTINFKSDRATYNVEQAKVVEEDLYDAKTNNTLESIVLIADPKEV